MLLLECAVGSEGSEGGMVLTRRLKVGSAGAEGAAGCCFCICGEGRTLAAALKDQDQRSTRLLILSLMPTGAGGAGIGLEGPYSSDPEDGTLEPRTTPYGYCGTDRQTIACLVGRGTCKHHHQSPQSCPALQRPNMERIPISSCLDPLPRRETHHSMIVRQHPHRHPSSSHL